MSQDSKKKAPMDPRLTKHILGSQKSFVSYLESKVKNREVAEDIFQTSILKALKNSHNLKDEQSVMPWFYQILKNSVMDYFREKKKTAAKSNKISQYVSELSNEGIFNRESQEQLCACFKKLFKTISPQYADLLNKIDLNEESIESLAKKEGTTANNLTVKLHRARRALRESLEAVCGACTKHGCLNCTCNM